MGGAKLVTMHVWPAGQAVGGSIEQGPPSANGTTQAPVVRPEPSGTKHTPQPQLPHAVNGGEHVKSGCVVVVLLVAVVVVTPGASKPTSAPTQASTSASTAGASLLVTQPPAASARAKAASNFASLAAKQGASTG